MASELTDFINNLENLGFYDVALPFILVFTLIFAILQKIKIFGENSKNFNAVIALAMALLVVRQVSIVEIMNQFLPQISLVALVFVICLQTLRNSCPLPISSRYITITFVCS